MLLNPLSLLSKIKLNHVLLIGVVALVVGFMHYKSKYESEKEIRKIKEENFQEILKITNEKDSTNIAYLRLQTNKEIESYINQNETLQNLLAKQGFESSRDYKKLENFTLSSIKYYDSLISTFNASVIVDKIKNNEDAIYEFSKEGECISFDGNLEYKNGELNVNTFNEQFKGNILVTRSLGQRTKHFPFKGFSLFRYGKREIKNQATTDCGDVEVQVVERIDKK